MTHPALDKFVTPELEALTRAAAGSISNSLHFTLQRYNASPMLLRVELIGRIRRPVSTSPRHMTTSMLNICRMRGMNTATPPAASCAPRTATAAPSFRSAG